MNWKKSQARCPRHEPRCPCQPRSCPIRRTRRHSRHGAHTRHGRSHGRPRLPTRGAAGSSQARCRPRPRLRTVHSAPPPPRLQALTWRRRGHSITQSSRQPRMAACRAWAVDPAHPTKSIIFSSFRRCGLGARNGAPFPCPCNYRYDYCTITASVTASLTVFFT